MGYYTYFTGSMQITPAIDESKWPEAYTEEGDDHFVLSQVEGDEDVQLINGVITVIGKTPTYTSVEIRWDESVKGYDFDERLKALIDWAGNNGSAIEGAFYADGEESGDFARYGVSDNMVSIEGGSVTYPSERNDHLISRASKGHGRVLPRKDGRQIACYGLPSCPECVADHEWFMKELYDDA